MRITRWIGFIAALMMVIPLAGAESGKAGVFQHDVDNLKISISQPPSSTDSDKGIIILSMKNTGSTPIAILKYATPFVASGGRLPNNLFKVTNADGTEVRYIGRFAKFTGMSPEKFLTLLPGQTISKAVDLYLEYDLSAGGPFSVSYQQNVSYRPETSLTKRSASLQALYPKESTEANAMSNSLNLWVNPALRIGANTHSIIFPADTSSGVCTSVQQTAIDTAKTLAQTTWYAGLLNRGTYTTNSDGSINGFEPTSQYTWWFGPDDYTPANDGLASRNLRIQLILLEAGNVSNMTNMCGCPGYDVSTLAWSETSSPYLIHICDSFYGAPSSGSDTQAGALLHEMSHFDVNDDGYYMKGTSDIAYGQSAAHNLAANNPIGAAQNADNFEYFFENNPSH